MEAALLQFSMEEEHPELEDDVDFVGPEGVFVKNFYLCIRY